jgi:hypothetical protein
MNKLPVFTIESPFGVDYSVLQALCRMTNEEIIKLYESVVGYNPFTDGWERNEVISCLSELSELSPFTRKYLNL